MYEDIEQSLLLLHFKVINLVSEKGGVGIRESRLSALDPYA